MKTVICANKNNLKLILCRIGSQCDFKSGSGDCLRSTLTLLTLKSDQGTFTPVGAQGMEPPPRKPLSHRNFAMKFTPYMYGT